MLGRQVFPICSRNSIVCVLLKIVGFSVMSTLFIFQLYVLNCVVSEHRNGVDIPL